MLVVGDSHTLKVHLHTDEPERATALFAEIGEVSHLDVADMTEQVAERSERLAEAIQTCGVLAVVSATGMGELFESLGAVALDGGGTLNPSTYELLAGIHEVPAEEVVVLPNSPNVIMAAERAAELAEKTVRVVPSRSMQAGLAAAVALEPGRGAAENADAMNAALANVRTGAVTEAARDDAEGRFRRGEAVGFVDEQLVAWGEPGETLEAVLGLLGREAELLTLIEGNGAPLDGDGVAALVPGGVDVEYLARADPARASLVLLIAGRVVQRGARIERRSWRRSRLRGHRRSLLRRAPPQHRRLETAAVAQARIVTAVDHVLAASPPGDVAIVAHGGGGTLLQCALRGAISRALDQPSQGHWFAFVRESRRVLHGWRRLESHN